MSASSGGAATTVTPIAAPSAPTKAATISNRIAASRVSVSSIGCSASRIAAAMAPNAAASAVRQTLTCQSRGEATGRASGAGLASKLRSACRMSCSASRLRARMIAGARPSINSSENRLRAAVIFSPASCGDPPDRSQRSYSATY
jgi:hypothetical protein